MKATLSLSMIVKDEERFLPGCLESVKGMVDEVVIVDTGSVDRTQEIAVKLGARVYSIPWTGDFAGARNEALARCTSDWILYLDADERLASGQQELLTSLINDPSVHAYNVQVRSRLSLEGGDTTEQVMIYPRLFRRGGPIRFEGKVHEQIAPSILRAGGRIESAGLLIEHLGYARGFETLRAKADRNLLLLKQAVDRDPDDWYSRYQIGKTELLYGNPAAAAEQINLALRGRTVSPAMRASMHNLLAEIALKGGNPTDAAVHCRESLSLVADQIGARWFLAGACVNGGNLTEAVAVLKELHTLQVTGRRWSTEVEDIVVSEDAVLELIGECCAGLSDFHAAADWLFKALEKDPGRETALTWLLKVHERIGKPDFKRLQKVLVEAEKRGIVNDDVNRFAFELAFRAGEYVEALTRLRAIAHLLSPEQFAALESRLVALDKASQGAIA